MTARRFEELVVWQLARKLVCDIYRVTRMGAFATDFGLRDQIQRAVVSIPSNIAEGYERNGNREFLNFLFIAKGSAGEVRSQLYSAFDLGYISNEQMKTLQSETVHVSASIANFISSIRKSGFSGIRYAETLEPSNVEP